MFNSRIESFAKYTGIATVIVEWLALLLYYTKMPTYFGGSYPISYFASLPQTRLVFNICYTLAGIFFWIFLRHHLHKYFNIPLKIIGLSMLLFIGMALMPFNPNNPTSVISHGTLGLTSAFLLAVGLFIMARNANNKYVYRATVTTLLVSLLFLLAFLNAPKTSNFIFIFEASSWLVLQIWVLWISFYTYKKPNKTEDSLSKPLLDTWQRLR
jgi:hypothetical protein